MLKRFGFLFLLLLILILEVSFFPAVFPYLILPNLLMVSTIIYVLLEKPEKVGSVEFALVAGILMDLMLRGFFGTYMIIFLVTSYSLKYILRHYVQLSFR